MENPFTPHLPESREAEPGTQPRMLFRILGYLAILILLSYPAFSQSIAVTSPAASQTLSGTLFTLACSLSSLPNAQSVEWFVNGVSQGVARSAPWSLTWNTNNVYNSATAWHTVYAVARDALGNILATSPIVNFGVYNSYLEPSSYISCGSITTSTPLASAWSGSVTVTVPITGSNASNIKLAYGVVAGDIRVYATSAPGTSNTTISIPINTTMFPNGVQDVYVSVRDTQGSSGTQDGYPFCEWEQQVSFQNSAGTPMELLVSPKEAVIAPLTTLQLSPIIDNTDGTTSAATGLTYSSGAAGVCTVNSSGLVAADAYGTCPITVTATNGSGYTRTIYEYVSSTNVVPFFGSDGAVHNTVGSGLWFASFFQSTSRTSLDDPFKSTAQYLSPYTQAGFQNYESSPVGGASSWGPNQTAWQAALNSFVTQYSGYLSAYHVFFHPQLTTVLGTCGGGNQLACSGGSSSLYNSTRNPTYCGGYTPNCWQYVAQQWYATGLLMGFSGQDEGNTDYNIPRFGSGVLGSTNGPSQITCVTSSPTTWTVTWPTPPGPIYNGTKAFIIEGGTTNSYLNVTIGALSNYSASNITSTTFSFAGPSCASGNVTVNAASDPGMSIEVFGFEWDNNNTDYVHNADYYSIVSGIHAGTGSATIPVAGSVQAGAGVLSQQGWQGNCTSPPPYADYAEIYDAQDNSAYTHPQHAWVTDFEKPNSQSLVAQIRSFWGNTCTPRGFVVKAESTTMDYGIQGPAANITSIAGPTVTFSAPHGISTVYPGVSRLTISGGANSYFNGNQMIDWCPTATTCDISLIVPSSGAIASSNPGTITFQDGNSWTNVTMFANATPLNSSLSCTGGGTCNSAQILKENGQRFTFVCTFMCSGTPAYYSNTTFVLRGVPIFGPVSGSGNTSLGAFPSQMFFDEVPPSSETSGSASAVLYPDNTYTRGVNLNVGENEAGNNFPFASCAAPAVLGGMGIRAYQGGADFTEQAVLGGGELLWGSTNNALIQAGGSPVYENGDTQAVENFWAFANCNIFFQSMAARGYLYQARYGAPDIGYNVESSLRKGSKGNLLLAINMQDGPQARTVDLSNCEVPGQPIIRYIVSNAQIAMTVLGAGTTSDKPTFPDAGLIAYLCSNNEAAEIDEPTIAARLADVSGASSIAVQFAYNPEAFSPFRFAQTPQAVLAANGTATLPVDRNIGPIYMRLVYLNGSGAVLATSDVETL